MTATALAILIVTAGLAPVLCRVSRRFGSLVVAAVPLALGVWFATSSTEALASSGFLESWNWLPDLGLNLAFKVDGLSLTFALLICFIGAGVLLYTTSYLAQNPRLGYFMSILTGFMAAMLGLILADNVILLFVFWELTSITSFLLIGFDHERERARWAATQALLTTGLGGLALLAGLILLGIAGGSWTISSLDTQAVLQSDFYAAIAVLVMLGSFTKSAIFPFHYWLPNAMEAPSPVSALLHSATMVKAGVYLLARLHPTMGGVPMWDNTLGLLGGVTMVAGAFLATRQHQLKKILAYSTVSSLGTLVMLIGLDAAKAAVTYLLAHAMFKGCLFLVAGTLTKMSGQKDPEQLGGLLRKSPALAIASLLAALSMAGMFPLIGFVSKEVMLKAGIAHPEYAIIATAAITVSAILTVMAALIVGVRPFFFKAAEGVEVAWKAAPGWRQLTLPVILAAGGVVAGLSPALFAKPLIAGMVDAIDPAGIPHEIKLDWLKLLYPPTLATYLSLGALALGTVFFLGRAAYRSITAPADLLNAVGPAKGYDGALAGVTGFAKLQTIILQNGSLQNYVRIMLATVVAVVAAALVRSLDLGVIGSLWGEITTFEIMLIAALIAAIFSSILQKTALATVACLSGVGFTIAMLFALLGAPDLAMTQFAVETLMLIIFVFVLFHLPRYRDLSKPLVRAADFGLASLFGVTLAFFVAAVLAGGSPPSIAEYHAANSLSGGYGRNVVNVILVDFRAIDTLGEIFVIGVAGIGVYTMLKLRAGNGGDETKPAAEPATEPVPGEAAS
ncbi:MAG: hydrogen gas-evolving membrane-bound hydrogenase subunit E [Planctomycetota bacterium]